MSKIDNNKINLKLFLISMLFILIVSNLENSTIKAEELYPYNNEKEEYSTAYLCSLFDDLDNKVNNGKGYSEYLKIDGFPTGALLAWSESHLMQ